MEKENEGQGNKIRVYIGDDHEYETRGMADLLEDSSEVEVIGSSNNLDKVISDVIKMRPDVLLLDMLWNRNKEIARQAISRIRIGSPTTRILAMSAYSDLLDAARPYGAHLTYDKDSLSDERELINRIKEVNSIPFPKLYSPSEFSLGDREMEVIRYLCKRLSNNEIAKKMFISEGTVRKYIEKIREKLEVHSQRDIISFAFLQHWISPEDNG